MKWFSIPEAAQTLGISPQRVHQLILAGRLHATRVGRAWAVSSRELKRFEGLPRPVGRPKKKGEGEQFSSKNP
jgi:excisionase family DNA binding protein